MVLHQRDGGLKHVNQANKQKFRDRSCSCKSKRVSNEEVNSAHACRGKTQTGNSLSCTRGWPLLHHTSGRPREQVGCTAALAWASLGDLMEAHVLIDVERHDFCTQSSVESCNVFFFFCCVFFFLSSVASRALQVRVSVSE